MEWLVYRHDINRDEIKKINIFDHGRFSEDVKKLIKKDLDKEEFAQKLRSELMYYFWSKCEHELVIKITDNERILLYPWCGCREPEKVKIDVTDDDYDWKGFAQKHISKQIYKNEAKIDIFEQVYYIWDDFVEYVWNNKDKYVRRRKK